MSIHRRLILPTLAAVIAGGNSLMAQVTTGSLSGIVTDASGKPLEKVRVTLESPALFTPRTYSTNADGEYRALLLPVGNYTIRVTANGMLSKTATGVRIGVGSNLTMPFSLKSAANNSTATVEVVATTASESKSDDKIASNFSAEKLLQLPTGGGPSFQGALGATPGVTGAYSLTTTMIRGGSTNQVMYRIDGINVKDDVGQGPAGGGGTGALYQPLPDSIEDVQVVLTALNARFGSVSGGQVNIVTKSGSNEFVGTIRSTFSRQSWQGVQSGASGTYSAQHNNEDLNKQTDITLSGPIIKDRLWFYVGTRLQPSQGKDVQLNYSVSGVPYLNGSATNAPLLSWDTVKSTYMGVENTYGIYDGVDSILSAGPGLVVNPNATVIGTGGTAMVANPAYSSYSVANVFKYAGNFVHASVDYKKYEGKLTGAITDSQILSATYLFEQTKNGGSYGERQTGSTAQELNPNQLGNITIQTKGYTINWNGTLASNWTIEARYAHTLYTKDDVPRPSGNDPSGQPIASGPSMWLEFQSINQNVALRPQYNNGNGGDNYFWGYTADYYRESSYNTMEKRGNNGLTVNVTTFQDFLGKHQIDFGIDQNQTVYDFGRGRAGHAAVWNGGEYMDNSGAVLYPVLQKVFNASGTVPAIRDMWTHAAGGTLAGLNTAGWNGATWQLVGNQYDMWWWSVTGPGATLERAWFYSGDEKNHTNSEYINDSWTINPQWNAMIGFRQNSMALQSAGRNLDTMSVLEPRFQIKYNPDGQNKKIFSFSWAKLSQAYSDEVANYFRASEWGVNTMTPWTGAALDAAIIAPGIDSPAAANDTPNGLHNGYNYNGTNMHGVRFVDFATISNEDNYSQLGAGNITDATQSLNGRGLKTPYAIEMNFGFQRNFSNGWFKLNLVQRKYHDMIVGHWWTGINNYGVGNWVVMHNPNPGDASYEQMNWQQSFLNNKDTQTYRNIEFSFDRQLSTRWDLTGSFTYDRTTGVVGNGDQYYSNLTLRNALIPLSKQGDIYPDGIIGEDKFGYLALTYIQPVGKGNISFAVRLNYQDNGGYTQPQSSLNYQNDISGFAAYSALVPTTITNTIDPTKTVSWNNTYGAHGVSTNMLNYNIYQGSAGQYRNSLDTFFADAKINGDVPLYGKLHLIGYIEIHNIFNSYQMTNMYTALSDAQQGGSGGFSNGTAGVQGRFYQKFDNSHIFGRGANAKVAGSGYQDYNWGNGGRSFANVSVGLKF